MAKPDASSSTSSSSRGSGCGGETNYQKSSNKIEIEIHKPNMKCVSSVDSQSPNMDTPIVDSTRAHNRKEKERMRKTLRENAKRLKLLEEQMQIISGAVSTSNGINDHSEDRVIEPAKIFTPSFPRKVEVNPEVVSKVVQISSVSSSPGYVGQKKSNVPGRTNSSNSNAIFSVNPDANRASQSKPSVPVISQRSQLCPMPQAQAHEVPFSLSRSSSLNTTPSSTPLQTPTEVVPPSHTTSATPSDVPTAQMPNRSLGRKVTNTQQSRTFHHLEAPSFESAALLQASSQAGRSENRNLNLIPSSAVQNAPTALKAVAKPPLFSTSNAPVSSSNSATRAENSSLTSPDSLDGFAGLNNNSNGSMDFSVHELPPTSTDLNLSVTSGFPVAADSLPPLNGPSFPLPSPSPRRPSWFGVPF